MAERQQLAPKQLEQPWKGPVTLQVKFGDRTICEKRQNAEIAPTEARHVRVGYTKRGTQWGNAIRELEVFP